MDATNGTLIDRVYAEAVAADLDRAGDPTRERILDAAVERFCRFGITHTSMNDIAHQAGVSRVTLYRRFATRDRLVEEVFEREFRRSLDRFLRDIAAAASLQERLELGLVSSLRSIRGNRLITGLLQTEPASLMTSLFGDDGNAVAVAQRFLAGQLRAEQGAGHIPGTTDVEVVAEMIIRICGSLVITPSRVVDLDDEDHLARLARTVMVPMLGLARLTAPRCAASTADRRQP